MARTPRRFGTNNSSTQHQLPDSADDLPDVVSIDLDAKDPNAFEVVEAEDRQDDNDDQQQDKGPATDADLTSQEDDLRGRLGKRVQKRIDRLVLETNTERRAREAAEQREQQAIERERAQAAENAELRRRLDGNTQTMSAAMQAEKDAKIADAQRRLTQAHADGDSAAIVAATTDLGQAQAEKLAIIARTPRPQTDAERAAEAERTRAAAQPQESGSRLAPAAKEWIDRNTWFRKPGYEARTAKAMSIHYELEARGVRPDSPNYGQELDKGMKAVYPDHQSSPSRDGEDTVRRERSTPRRTDVTAEGSRATERQQPTNSRIVELTRSELSIAKTLNLTPAQYAASKLKNMAAGVAHDE